MQCCHALKRCTHELQAGMLTLGYRLVVSQHPDRAPKASAVEEAVEAAETQHPLLGLIHLLDGWRIPMYPCQHRVYHHLLHSLHNAIVPLLQLQCQTPWPRVACTLGQHQIRLPSTQDCACRLCMPMAEQCAASCKFTWSARSLLDQLIDDAVEKAVDESWLLGPMYDHEHPGKTALSPVLQRQAVNPAPQGRLRCPESRSWSQRMCQFAKHDCSP